MPIKIKNNVFLKGIERGNSGTEKLCAALLCHVSKERDRGGSYIKD